MRKKIVAFLLVITSTLSVGCGGLSSRLSPDAENDELKKEEIISSGYDDHQYTGQQLDKTTLASGVFYVKHKDNTCEPVYWGNSNISSGSDPGNGDIMWFQEDFNNIPTFYEGDELIYYTEEALPESFNFSRFEYFGYSVGLCGLSETPSGRLKMSTDPNDYNTFPESDADELLYMPGDYIVIESIGDMKLRYDRQILQDIDKGIAHNDGKVYITRLGTIQGLNANEKYDVDAFSGTKGQTVVLTADKIITGFKEKMKTVDYEYDKKNDIIVINIPDNYAKGYYIINGSGMFRYAKGTKWNINDPDFNNENEPENIEEKTSNMAINENVEVHNNGDPTYENINEEGVSNAPEILLTNEAVNTFKVASPGLLAIRVTFENPELPDGQIIGDTINPSAYIEDPVGVRYAMEYKNHELFMEIDAKLIGTYKVVYKDLYGKIPHLEVG